MSWGLQRWGRYQIVKDYGGICRKDLSVRKECSTLKVHEHFTHAASDVYKRQGLSGCSSRYRENGFGVTDEGRQEGRRHRKVDAPRTPYRWSVIAPLWC